VRRTAAALAAVLVLGGCSVNGGDDGSSSSGAQAPERVTTTRVQVVQGIGRRGGFDPREIYKRLSPGVVTVISIFDGNAFQVGEDGGGGQGSGFVLDGDGYVATNAHVVTEEASNDRAGEVYVELSDGNRAKAEIVGVDLNADVALLKIDPSGLSLTPLELGSSHDITVGEPVAAIGSPFGERQSLSIGVVSAVDRNIRSLTRFGIGDAIQTDAAINPGNSGGPLLDSRGEVLGINAQIKTESGGGEGVGFAVPVDAVRRSLDELRAKGRVDYGYLGVTTLAVWPQLAERIDAPGSGGALVQEVEGDSPADAAGIEAGDDEITFQGQPDIVTGGDLIVAVDGNRLTRTHDLTDIVSTYGAGETVTLTVVRDGRQRDVKVKLGRRPGGSGS
jgi:S1-C subfamily serine protease